MNAYLKDDSTYNFLKINLTIKDLSSIIEAYRNDSDSEDVEIHTAASHVDTYRFYKTRARFDLEELISNLEKQKKNSVQLSFEQIEYFINEIINKEQPAIKRLKRMKKRFIRRFVKRAGVAN